MSGKALGTGGVRRREVLGGVALLGAAGAVGIARMLPRTGTASVMIFDGGRPASWAFTRSSAAPRRIDLAEEARTNWRGLRSLGQSLGRGEGVTGVTGWAAYVAARGWLEEQGLRLTAETLDRRTGLVIWSMA